MTELTDSPSSLESGQEVADELRAVISGSVALPPEKSYEAASRVWNWAIPHRPAMIAFCQSAADVEAAVRVARRHRLPFSVRGGGHDWAGRALCNKGLVLDLTRMRHVVVDPHSRVATVAGGAKVKDLATAADAYDLLAALGGCGAVGVAGLSLGGGYGPLAGAHGLAADNLLSAEIVLADGRRVTTDAHNEPDLFWALRGGGGNFGVVTSLRIRLHEMSDMLAGSIVYPWSEAESVLNRYAAFAPAAPDELGLIVGMASGPDGQPSLSFSPLWNGEKNRGEGAIDKLTALGKPRLAQIGLKTYIEMLEPLDTMVEEAAGCHWETRTRWLPALTPGAIGAMTAAIAAKTSLNSMILLHPFHGAATRVAPDATAFGVRCDHFLALIIAGWKPHENDGSVHRKWAQDLWQDLGSFALPGGYANVLPPHDQEQARDAYGRNGARLRTLKCRFDPDGVFASAIPLPG